MVRVFSQGKVKQGILTVNLDGVLRWVARLAARRGVSLALIAAIVITDLAIPWAGWGHMPRWQGLSFVPRAFVDEPCAVATALIVLGAVTRFRGSPPDPKFGWSLIAWSVLIDIDHLPQEFGTSVLTKGTSRPYFHALWVLLLLCLTTLLVLYWSQVVRTPVIVATMQILAGTTWGIAAHFLRDAATAPISLWWPVTKAAVQQPYWWYVLELLAIVAFPLVRRRPRSDQAETSEPVVAASDDRT